MALLLWDEGMCCQSIKTLRKTAQKKHKNRDVQDYDSNTGTVLEQKGVTCGRVFWSLTVMVILHRERIWALAPFLQCPSQRLCAYPDDPDPFLHGYKAPP